MTFDQPTQVVQFGVAINVGGVRDEAVTVEVYGPNNKLREIIDMDLAPAPFFAGGWFSYEKDAVKKVCVTFNGPGSRFAVDNLTFHKGN